MTIQYYVVGAEGRIRVALDHELGNAIGKTPSPNDWDENFLGGIVKLELEDGQQVPVRLREFYYKVFDDPK